jgi:hypothetical protein
MLVEALSYLPILGAATITAMGGWIAAQRMARSNEKLAAVKRADDDRKERVDGVNSNAEDMTERFRILMDGYENRIEDLTSDINSLRSEVASLRSELSSRPARCDACPLWNLKVA